MSLFSEPPTQLLPKRLLSVDVFRAVTMLLMIFVNDVAGVHHIPNWIEHTEADTDGMGFADSIFPAFLFIVGLSLPLAIQKKYSQGKGHAAVLYYIASRSVALLIMGFYHVNSENYNDDSSLPRSVWIILTTIGFFLIWLDYSKVSSKKLKYICVSLGIGLLLAMAVVYKGGSDEEPIGMETSWWGILGIIGWAYLLCAILFFVSKQNIIVNLGWLITLIAVNLGVHLSYLHFNIRLIGDGSSATLTMAGVVVMLLYQQYYKANKMRTLWAVLSLSAVVFLAGGLLIRPYAGGISKIYSTPAWVFICTAIGIAFFGLFIYLIDIKEKKDAFKWIKPAGTSTLTCYLLPYFLYSLYSLVGFHFPYVLNNGVGGILRSFFIAFFIVFIAGLLERKSIRLSI